MMQEERVALFLLCCVGATVFGAYFILEGIGKEPLAVIYENESAAGTLVSLQGTVAEMSRTKTGGHSRLIVDGVNVFVPASAGEVRIARGDRVRIIGTIQMYHGTREILVTSPSDIRILP